MKPPLPIERIGPIDQDAFYDRYVRKSKPVVITGLTDQWTASRLWSHEYMLEQYGAATVQAYQLNSKGECDVDMDKGSPTRPTVLSDAMLSMREAEISRRWAIATSVDHFPEQLRTEFAAPAYCADGRFLRSMIFIGAGGVVSPLHQDLPENIYVMVQGCKRITLFSPWDHVYPNPRLSNLPNHSQIDAERPDLKKFPDVVYAQPYIVDLRGGETLFIPSLWWHHLRNLEPSIALNFWWSQGWKLPIAMAAALYKKWRAI
ncbi:MAG: cupin-like domain-containing protein [Bacteroidetes bacterium]|nr:cupin-like domain-containing protein [Bacteroidota bacterium]